MVYDTTLDHSLIMDDFDDSKFYPLPEDASSTPHSFILGTLKGSVDFFARSHPFVKDASVREAPTALADFERDVYQCARKKGLTQAEARGVAEDMGRRYKDGEVKMKPIKKPGRKKKVNAEEKNAEEKKLEEKKAEEAKSNGMPEREKEKVEEKKPLKSAMKKKAAPPSSPPELQVEEKKKPLNSALKKKAAPPSSPPELLLNGVTVARETPLLPSLFSVPASALDSAQRIGKGDDGAGSKKSGKRARNGELHAEQPQKKSKKPVVEETPQNGDNVGRRSRSTSLGELGSSDGGSFNRPSFNEDPNGGSKGNKSRKRSGLHGGLGKTDGPAKTKSNGPLKNFTAASPQPQPVHAPEPECDDWPAVVDESDFDDVEPAPEDVEMRSRSPSEEAPARPTFVATSRDTYQAAEAAGEKMDLDDDVPAEIDLDAVSDDDLPATLKSKPAPKAMKKTRAEPATETADALLEPNADALHQAARTSPNPKRRRRRSKSKSKIKPTDTDVPQDDKQAEFKEAAPVTQSPVALRASKYAKNVKSNVDDARAVSQITAHTDKAALEAAGKAAREQKKLDRARNRDEKERRAEEQRKEHEERKKSKTAKKVAAEAEQKANEMRKREKALRDQAKLEKRARKQEQRAKEKKQEIERLEAPQHRREADKRDGSEEHLAPDMENIQEHDTRESLPVAKSALVNSAACTGGAENSQHHTAADTAKENDALRQRVQQQDMELSRLRDEIARLRAATSAAPPAASMQTKSSQSHELSQQPRRESHDEKGAISLSSKTKTPAQSTSNEKSKSALKSIRKEKLPQANGIAGKPPLSRHRSAKVDVFNVSESPSPGKKRKLEPPLKEQELKSASPSKKAAFKLTIQSPPLPPTVQGTTLGGSMSKLLLPPVEISQIASLSDIENGCVDSGKEMSVTGSILQVASSLKDGIEMVENSFNPQLTQEGKGADEVTTGRSKQSNVQTKTNSDGTSDDSSSSGLSGSEEAVQNLVNEQFLSDVMYSKSSQMPETQAKDAAKKEPVEAKKQTEICSPHFEKKERRNRTGGDQLSSITIPSTSATKFGLIQEELAAEPFKLLVAVILLNKTTNTVAIPMFRHVIAKYPTPTSLAKADADELSTMIESVGLQNMKAKTLVRLAQTFIEQPPVKGKRHRTVQYPGKWDSKHIKKDEVLGDDVSALGALEVGHLPGCGPYAWDSWRIFCRDVCRGVAEGWNGEGAKEEGFEPEWKRVLPRDKELRAFLKWMWLKEGFVWDPVTGSKEIADKGMLKRGEEGGKAVRKSAVGKGEGKKRGKGEEKIKVHQQVDEQPVDAVRVPAKESSDEETTSDDDDEMPDADEVQGTPSRSSESAVNGVKQMAVNGVKRKHDAVDKGDDIPTAPRENDSDTSSDDDSDASSDVEQKKKEKAKTRMRWSLFGGAKKAKFN